MSKLKLDIPKVKYPENSFPILADHPDMMYWLTKDNMFCKTIKHFQKKHNINALNNEIRIMEYLKNKEKNISINPPIGTKNSPNGSPIIIQKAIKGIDFFQYIKCGKNGFSSCVAFLDCVGDVLKYFYKHHIIFNDYALENFMIKSENPLKLTLVDFGCAEIFDEDKIYTWDFTKIFIIRNHLISPDIIRKYNIKKEMSRDEIFDLMLKKDMFAIGVLLYSIICGCDAWDPTVINFPDKKFEDMIIIHSFFNKKISTMNPNDNMYLICRLLLRLLPFDIDDMISMEEFFDFIAEIKAIDRNQKKRKFGK